MSANLEGEFFAFKVGEAEFNFLASEAEFEYLSAEEAKLLVLQISSAQCACCLSINFFDPLKPGHGPVRNLPDASLLICELRAN